MGKKKRSLWIFLILLLAVVLAGGWGIAAGRGHKAQEKNKENSPVSSLPSSTEQESRKEEKDKAEAAASPETSSETASSGTEAFGFKQKPSDTAAKKNRSEAGGKQQVSAAASYAAVSGVPEAKPAEKPEIKQKQEQRNETKRSEDKKPSEKQSAENRPSEKQPAAPEVKPAEKPEKKPEGKEKEETTPPETERKENTEQEEKLQAEKLYRLENGWSSFSLYIYHKKPESSPDQVKADVLGKIPEEKRQKVFFGQIFPDENAVLVAAPAGIFAAEDAESTKLPLPRAEEGIYTANENRDLIRQEDPSASFPADTQILVFAGKVSNPHLLTAEYIIGLPGNELHLGVMGGEKTRTIAGMNFMSAETRLERGSNSSAISLGKEKLNLTVEGNSVRFDGTPCEMSKAVVGYSVQGKIRILDNDFSGKNIDRLRRSVNCGVVQFMSRSTDLLDAEIRNNRFQDIASAAMQFNTESNETFRILDNVIDGTNDDGIKLSLFSRDYPEHHHVTIRGNRIRHYGQGEYQSYGKGGAGDLEPSNDNEFGIEMSYTNPTYGAMVNETWVSSEEELQELLIMQNEIMEKEQNDRHDQVVDSMPVKVGQKSRFLNTAEEINKEGYRNKNHFFVITKNENGSVTYGQNSEDPAAELTVGGLFITGTGSGVVTLPATLHIQGDLVVDLPNGTVSNHAQVSGKQEIKAQSSILNDAVFKLVPDHFTRGEAPEKGIEIHVSDIRNDQGQPVSMQSSHLEDLRIFVNGTALSPDRIRVEEQNDRIVIEKEEADTWKAGKIRILAEFHDEKNGVSKISSSNMILQVEDKSAAKLEFDSRSFIHMNPENREIVIRVKELQDKNGMPVTAEKSRLKALFMRGSQAVSEGFVEVDDEKDEIHLKPELLAAIPASRYTDTSNKNFGTPVTYTIRIFDEENGIGSVEEDVRFDVTDSSTAVFAFEKGMTFTQGQAPESGIKLYVKNIMNTSGQRVSARQSVLEGAINIEPFPVKRDNTPDSEIITQTDGEGNFVREIFNPRYLVIDDQNDTITFTQEYLNKMQTQNDASTESGVKIFTFTYRDETARVDMRSDKVALYIKKQEVPKSSHTGIRFKENTVDLENGKIVSRGFVLNDETMVSALLAHVLKQNPRQQVQVEAEDGTVRRSYAALREGDRLTVTAEDGTTKVAYPIVLEASQRPELILSADPAVVRGYDNAQLRYKKGCSVSQLLEALKGAEGVTFTVTGEDQQEADPSSAVETGQRLQGLYNGKTYFWILRGVHEEAQSRALLVGNHDYEGEKLDLTGPPNDLMMMESVFRGNRLNGRETALTVGRNFTKEQFLQAIKTAFAGAGDDDVSYLYYSGHGNNVNNVSYICTVDTLKHPDGTFDTAGWISVDELKAALDAVPGTKVLLLDCCNAGGFIGKNMVDATTSATPRGVDGRRSTLDTSADFLRDMKDTFEKKREYNADLQYLTDGDYKVLAASSANEYSYEDKKEGIGKFTKMLAQAAGLDGTGMKGDADGNGKLGLNEAYDYLMATVASISHIQVFPYGDPYPVFENVAARPLSDNAEVFSDVYTVRISRNSKGRYTGMIRAKAGEVIDADQTAEEFIGKFKKGEEHQVLRVVRREGMEWAELADTEVLGEKLIYLQVTAQNGNTARYPFSPKKKPVPAAGNSTAVTTVHPAISIITEPIKAVRLTGKMDVETFLRALVKGEEGQRLSVHPRGEESPAKEMHETVEQGDYLKVTAADGIAVMKYNITVVADSADLKPDFGGAFLITEGKIVSGTRKLTEKMTVSEFMAEIKNMDTLRRQLDEVGNGVFAAGDTAPWSRPKSGEQTLKNGDILKLKPLRWDQPAVSFVIEIPEEKPDAGEDSGGASSADAEKERPGIPDIHVEPAEEPEDAKPDPEKPGEGTAEPGTGNTLTTPEIVVTPEEENRKQEEKEEQENEKEEAGSASSAEAAPEEHGGIPEIQIEPAEETGEVAESN